MLLRDRGDSRARGLDRRALLKFALRALVAVVAVGVATLLVAQAMSEKIAIRDARTRGDAFARGVAAPLVNTGVRSGEPVPTATFAAAMNHRMRAGEIVHMKLWAVDGTVLWSDETGLAGRRFQLEEPVRSMAGGSFAHAEISNLSQPENVLETDTGNLLEVYVGTKDADGAPMIFETYWSATKIHRDEQRVFWTLAPLSLGAMALLLVLMLPLAISLARNANRSVRERNRILQHALGAADLERTRIAQMLHDGVIQDLAGLGYALPSAASRLLHTPESDQARAIIDDATEMVRRDLTALRTLLVDIYPPSLALGELARAINDLAATAEKSGLIVSVEVQTDRPLGHGTNQLVYRIVREGLLNVVKHTTATRAWVTILAIGTQIEVSVRDNEPDADPVLIAEPSSGHIGLRLLFDAVADQGGELTIGPAAEGGTLLTGSFPVPEQDE